MYVLEQEFKSPNLNGAKGAEVIVLSLSENMFFVFKSFLLMIIVYQQRR